ncbi:unnamed protein product [Ambrosiozyma monospora]|uniref:Unnamed protein product n=1 Tax=Ambrosiozyma monospora TaxID=43982 RepID=A0A9W7DEH8_AMBMO|nr:unnamed protein product [Ambrosiozyma monospora]
MKQKPKSKTNNSNPKKTVISADATSPYLGSKSTYFDSMNELSSWFDKVTDPETNYNFDLDQLKRATENYHSFSRNKPVSSTDPNNASTTTTMTPSKKNNNNETTSTAPSLSSNTQGQPLSDEDSTELMVCHDFKNGYQHNEDENPLGYFPHPSGHRYFIQYPQFVDKFVYFSHHRISVPPSSWVNMCHKNGIKCFGTIIFEGNNLHDWEQLDKLVSFDTEENSFKFVEMLVLLVEYFGFDGYLLNIETKFSNNKIGSLLLSFVDDLKAELHKLNTKNEVIWYDAYVYPYNTVYYMNGVTEHNYNFYSSSDSFFTNYWWNIKHLQENIKNVGILGVKKKVFVGYDVWGRGSLIGKGGFDSSIACQVIQKYKSNVALFAPAWTYEFLGKKNFIENDTRFWVGLFEEESSIATTIKPYNSAVYKINDSSFAFYTNFSNGEGDRFFQDGNVVFDDHWLNSNIQFDIPINVRKKNKNHGLKWTLSKDDAFIGGSCLEIKYDEFISDDGYEIYNDQLVQNMTLFKLYQECTFHTIGLKITYKLNHKTKSIFKLKIKYYIERRYRTNNKVRTGYLILPLISTSDKWFTINENFQISTQDAREYIVLESVELSYDDDNVNDNFFRSFTLENSVITSVIDNEEYEQLISGDVYNDNEDEDWVLIPMDLSAVSGSTHSHGNPAKQHDSSVSSSSFLKGKSQSQQHPILKIGELSIVNANNYPSENYFNVSKVTKVDSTLISHTNINNTTTKENDTNSKKLNTKKVSVINYDTDELLLCWNRPTTNSIPGSVSLQSELNRGVSYYLVYVNGEFIGVSHTGAYLVNMKKLISCGLNFKDDKGNDDGKGIGMENKYPVSFVVRVDSVDRIGNVIDGSDVSITVTV